jgi:hypothetical protein
MRKFAMVGAGALAAAVAIVPVAHASGQAPEIRKLSGSVSTQKKGAPKAHKPASLNFTLATTRPFGFGGVGTCTSFGMDCVLPNIAIHDDITLPSGFKFNGGILKGNSQGKVKGSPLFPVCTGGDKTGEKGIPDIVEQAGGPGSKCKSIGGGNNAATGYTHTCRDAGHPPGAVNDKEATIAQQEVAGRKISADITVYNGGGKADGDGGKLYARLFVKSASAGSKIAEGAILVTFTKNNISFEVPDNLVEPFTSCAPLTNTVLSIVKKSGQVKRKVHGKVVQITRGLIETGACKKPSKTWVLSNTVRTSSGAVDPNTQKIIRKLSDPNVQTTTGKTNPALKCSL